MLFVLFASNNSLTSVSINFYEINSLKTTSTEIVKQFFLDLRKLKSLRFIEINNFEGDDVAAALKIVYEHKRISSLVLINCDLSTLQSFPLLPSLTRLRLIDCQLSEISLRILCESISASKDTLELLDLRGSSILSCHSACQILHDLVKTCTKLSKLILELCNIDDIGLKVLCGPGFQRNIRSLLLGGNMLHDCDVWSGGIANSELVTIDLSDNPIGRNSKSFGYFIKACSRSVECLQLESCHLSTESLEHMCLILGQENSRILDLRLSHNEKVGEVASSIA